MKNKLIFGGIALIAPAIVTPLVCATKATTNGSQINEDKTEIFHIGTSSSYTVQFDDTTKTCKLIRLEINDSVINSFQVPASCNRNGESGTGEMYPLTELDCEGRHPGSNTIATLDLSTAKNLVTIRRNCFKNDNGNNKLNISWVNFTGANKLTTIEEYAFYNQSFHTDYAPKGENTILDWSDTNITTIGEGAFKACCTRSHNKFDSIIFPASLQTIGNNAFDYDYSAPENQICVKHIYFNTINPTSSLLGNDHCLPQIKDAVTTYSVIFPKDQTDVYKSLPNINQTASAHISDNSWGVNNVDLSLTKGTEVITTASGVGGTDTQRWIPWIRKGSSWEQKEGLTLSLSNSYDGVFTIQDGKLTWDASIKSGIYKLTVQTTYQDTIGALGKAISPVITITVGDVELTGGTTVLYGTVGVAGKDKNIWSLTLNGLADGLFNQRASIIDLPAGWTEADFPVEVESLPITTQSNQFQIKWQSNGKMFTEAGSYIFTLRVRGETTLGLTVEARHQIAIVISATSYDLSVYKDDSSIQKVETNTKIEVTQGDATTKPYTIRFEDSAGTEVDIPAGFSKPQLSLGSSIGLCKLVSKTVDGHTRWDLQVNPSVNTGTYVVYAHSTVPLTLSTGYTIDYPLVTYEFTIVVKPKDGYGYSTDKLDMTGGTDVIGAKKLTAGRDSNYWKLTTLDSNAESDWVITDIQKEVVPWLRLSDKEKMLSHITPTLTSDGIAISWDNELSTTDEWMEIFEYNLNIDAVSTETQEHRTIVLPLAFYLTNIGTIQTNLPETITSIPKTTGEVENHIEFRINSKILQDSNTKYELETTSLDDADHIHGHYDAVSGHYIVNWDNTLDIGHHAFKIIAYSWDYFAKDVRQFTLDVKNTLTLVDVPETVYAETYHAGKTAQPIKVQFNNQEVTIKDQVTFSVAGAPVGSLWIDDEGYINWNEKLGAGIYNIVLRAVYTNGDVSAETLTMFELSVKQVLTPAQKSTFIGVTVGVGVGGLGLGIGGTFAGKAIANKKKTNNKK